MIRVGISGLGAVGRRALRIAEGRSDVQIVAVNGPGATATMAHLLKYDSNYGTFAADVSSDEDHLYVNGRSIRTFHEREPAKIDWQSEGVELVIEASGKFNDPELAKAHLQGGARRVVLAAPAKVNPAPTFILGVNADEFDPKEHFVMSMGSCTTNCLLPVMKVLDDAFGVEEGMMTAVHSYTSDQNLLDKSHKDLRRARAAAVNIIPTSTGAAKAVKAVWPELGENFHGLALRVPTQVVSAVDLVVRLRRPADAKGINHAMRAAAEGPMRGILDYTEAPLVSSDLRGSPASATLDAGLTAAVGQLAKVMAWYDNEWGYATRLVDLAAYIAKREEQ
ncbi:MAG: type I glyceraldehyde-3-phosphate dehydrogenase [Thermaerobacter sp.]|nr:type I glyceraldehyde-3-phosphate dehydrogenase [Thermaerobacter sp.]